MKYKVGITDYVEPPFDVEQEAFPDAEFIHLNSENEHEFDTDVMASLDAILVWHAGIGQHSAEHLQKAKIVVRYGVGFDSIDIASLEENNIVFSNTPDYGTEEVADTACAMILNLQRKVSEYDFECRSYESGWQENILSPIKRTNQAVLGIIGVGRIGTTVINRMRSFGYKIVGYDSLQPPGHEKAIGYHRVNSLEELLAESDIVSIHTPLNDGTRGMVNNDFIRAMKPGSSLVVTSRGGIIDGLDCIRLGLETNHLASVALDVLPDEPPSDDDPLIIAWRNREKWLSGRFLVNPHSSYFSEQALYEMRYKAAETAKLFLEQGVQRSRITFE